MSPLLEQNANNLFDLAGKEIWEGTYLGATFPMSEIAADDEKMKLFVERYSQDFPNDSTAGFSQLGWSASTGLSIGTKKSRR